MIIYYIPAIFFLATVDAAMSHTDEILLSGRLNSIGMADNNIRA